MDFVSTKSRYFCGTFIGVRGEKMLLGIAGFLMVAIFMTLIMTKKLSPMTALVVIPILFAVVLGFVPGLEKILPDLAKMMKEGVVKVAPTGIMIAFAIMYFGTMISVGLFDPLINGILKATHGDPLKITVGTALLAALVSLDGDGSTTYMVVCSAMLAVHRRVGISPLVLPTVAVMMNQIMNIIPWGGPTGRVMAALNLEAGQVFTPLIPGMIVAAIWVLLVSYILGKRERKLLGYVPGVSAKIHHEQEVSMADDEALKRPKLFWFNLILTILLMVFLIKEVFSLNVLFIIGTAIALIINYPKLKDQQTIISTHGANAMPVVGMVFCAGIFMGIMSGTKMVDAMAGLLVNNIPTSMGPHLGLVTALTSLPFTFFLTNDAYYFGVLPVLTKAAATYGITAAEMARASLTGQGSHLLSPLVPSTYLLVGMAGVNFGDLQKSALLWSIGSSIIMIIVAITIGIIPF
jgi:citrate-Mg2+:H+ or citrate-Ca2+:H+ symporter, CitMHS family